MAAGVWNSLAAGSWVRRPRHESVITRLTTESWMGPASMAMVAAAQPYLAWLTYTMKPLRMPARRPWRRRPPTGGLCDDDSAAGGGRGQPGAAGGPGDERHQGINTPAIMATEALYAEMWAPGRSGYVRLRGASGSRRDAPPLSPPSQITGGLAAQSAAVIGTAAHRRRQPGEDPDRPTCPTQWARLPSHIGSRLDRVSGIIADIDACCDPVRGKHLSAVNTAAWYVAPPSPPRYSWQCLNSGAPVAIAEERHRRLSRVPPVRPPRVGGLGDASGSSAQV